MSSTAIFIRSFRRDFPFLHYCLRSLQKFAVGFSEIIVAVPYDDVPLISHLTAETVIGVHDAQPGYLGQQQDKLNADRHTKADYIIHIDSDCLITEPITPEYFFKDGLPSYTITPFEQAREDQKKAWLHTMVKAIRKMPEHEFMRRNCIIYPRFIYAEFREFMLKTHGLPMEAYVMSQPNNEFSEFNVLGFYAWLYHRDALHWHNTETDGIPQWPWIQHWSGEGVTPEIRAQYERILV